MNMPRLDGDIAMATIYICGWVVEGPIHPSAQQQEMRGKKIKKEEDRENATRQSAQ